MPPGGFRIATYKLFFPFAKLEKKKKTQNSHNLPEFTHQEVKQCPSQCGSCMARMKHMLEYAKSNKAPYSICNVSNSQTFFLPCSLYENRWFIQLYFKSSIFTEPQLDPLFKVACLAQISVL